MRQANLMIRTRNNGDRPICGAVSPMKYGGICELEPHEGTAHMRRIEPWLPSDAGKETYVTWRSDS